MRSWKGFLSVLILIALIQVTACGSQKDKLVGKWERNDTSSYTGMQIEIKKLDDGSYRGTIVKTGKNGLLKNGDVKWNEIKKVAENEYDFKDLGDDASWYEMHFTINDDGSIIARNLVDTGEEGSIQKWVRAGALKSV